MKELFFGTGIAHTLLLFALVIASGLWLGRFKVKGVSIGTTWILFLGILLSHFGFRGDPTALAFMKDFGLILFVFSIGLQVGPGFFQSFRKGGVTMNLLATGMILLAVLVTLSIHWITGENLTTMVGVMSGAVTNTPGLGAAQQALSDAGRDDASVLNQMAKIKKANKDAFAAYALKEYGFKLNPDALFDVQVKRLHEYKRQLLNVMHIIYLYRQIREGKQIQPRTFLFGAKAAAGYSTAKRIIELLNSLSREINGDPRCKDQLQVFFLENYRVSLAEKLMPAAELSEQISTAGKEASGTGNMKLMMNGALTIGTEDGANVEMHQVLGNDNIFIFGLTADEVADQLRNGYNPYEFYNRSATIRDILNTMSQGFSDGKSYSDLSNGLLFGNGGQADPYLLLADFERYCFEQEKAAETYRDQKQWNQMSVTNVARSGIFASDRSIVDYAERIWHVDVRNKD